MQTLTTNADRNFSIYGGNFTSEERKFLEIKLLRRESSKKWLVANKIKNLGIIFVDGEILLKEDKLKMTFYFPFVIDVGIERTEEPL